MSLILWIVSFALYSAFAYWVVCKGGADSLEGWLSAFFISWWAINWDAEQIRFYMLCLWIVALVLFIIGLINEPYRMYRLGDRSA